MLTTRPRIPTTRMRVSSCSSSGLFTLAEFILSQFGGAAVSVRVGYFWYKYKIEHYVLIGAFVNKNYYIGTKWWSIIFSGKGGVLGRGWICKGEP